MRQICRINCRSSWPSLFVRLALQTQAPVARASTCAGARPACSVHADVLLGQLLSAEPLLPSKREFPCLTASYSLCSTAGRVIGHRYALQFRFKSSTLILHDFDRSTEAWRSLGRCLVRVSEAHSLSEAVVLLIIYICMGTLVKKITLNYLDTFK